MKLSRTILAWSILWVAGITGLHCWLNLDLFRHRDAAAHSFRVGFLPVT